MITKFALACAAVLVASQTARAARYEENNPLVQFNGNWQMVMDANASGGGYAVSNTAGSTVTFTFTGDSLTIYRVMNVDGGDVTMTVDGVQTGPVHAYFQMQRYQVPAVMEHLGAAQHTIVLTVNAARPAGSTGTNFYFDAFETPQTFSPSAQQQTALTQLNLYRQQAGLPLAQLSESVDLAAQAHAQYNLATGILGHQEIPGTSNFVGVNPPDRMGYFGCWQGGSEDAAQLGNAAWAIDGWLASVYHRVPMMTYRLVDVGYGGAITPGTVSGMDVMDFSSQSGQPPAARVITTYPASGQMNILSNWGISGETPSPFPAGTNPPYGFPISLHIAQGTGSTAGTDTVQGTGALNDSNGQPVQAFYLDRTVDQSGFLTGDDYFLIPMQPLQPNSSYMARITGTDLMGNKFDNTWQFTTGSGAAILSILPFSLTSTNVWIQWLTDGPVTSTQINFGTDTTYGTTVMGVANNPPFPTSVAAQLSGLAPATTYHYQITATDASGVTLTSNDATFTTPSQ
jgi:uncharacterized protein YkwD